MVTTRERTDGLRAGVTAVIGYMNAQGRVTTRRIDIVRDYGARNGEHYLCAYCHLRGEERTFRLDRVVAVYEVHNPEAVPSSIATGRQGTPSSIPTAPATKRGPSPQTSPQPSPPAASTSQRSAPRATTRSAPRGRRRIRPTLIIATVCIGVFYGVTVLGNEAGRRPEPTPAPQTMVGYAGESSAGTGGTETAAPTPDPSDTIWYRGTRIVRQREGGSSRYLVPDNGDAFATLHDARVSINTSALRRILGMRRPELYERYAKADLNRDGNLDWEEIQRFQDDLYREFRYVPNRTALRPDAFLRNGGGDCEDWAIVAAGLLQFWQVPVYIAAITSEAGRHAVALVRTPKPPAGSLYFTFQEHWNLPDSAYVPIDYNVVGGLSNAVAGEYWIDEIWEPQEIYDEVL